MHSRPTLSFIQIFLSCLIFLIVSVHSADKKGSMTMPDFTVGGSIPAGALHDWTLGATGARGWMYSENMETSHARQILVTKIDEGSPSANILAVGDVLLGVAGKPFAIDPRTEIGQALTAAEAESGELELIRWRAGKEERVVVHLPVLGIYSATAPYNCPKSALIFKQGCAALALKMEEVPKRQNPIPRSLNALALLASGDPIYLPLIKREAEWAAGFTADSFSTWYYGYLTIFLSEYIIATGDDSVMPGLRRIALESARGQSAVGSWGHKFAGDDGRLVGYGMMNSPGIPLTCGLVLAKKAGLHEPEVDVAIERSAKLLRFYTGKGAIPYGDHYPWMQCHEDNGKCGMATVLFDLLGEAKPTEFFSKMSVASYGSERDTGHTGNFFNILWAMPAVARSGPQATGEWMGNFGSWYFDLARRWDGTFIHQGPPQMKADSYKEWDSTGAILLAYAMPLKKIHLTGKTESVAPQLDLSQAKSLIRDGRGWTNGDRNGGYDKLAATELLSLLGNWSPVVRERAAMAIGRRPTVPIDDLIKLLDSAEIYKRLGASQALKELKNAAEPAVPSLMKRLKDDDLWVRVKAGEALSTSGPAGMKAVPYLLTMIAKVPTNDDPRAMEQRFLAQAVFGTMLRKSLDGVDRELLRNAIVAGLKNEDGRARGSVGIIYQNLSYEEIEPLLPVIYEAVITRAPSGIMFADEICILGLEILAKHRIREGLPLCIEVMGINRWGKANRITKCLKALSDYGAAAKPLLPKLRILEKELIAHGEAKGLQQQIKTLQAIMTKLESSDGAGDLRNLKNIKK